MRLLQSANLLFRPIKRGTFILFIAMISYISFSLFLFSAAINPSLTGETQQHISADSVRYMYYAQSLRDGGSDPFVLAALYSFPNTLWAPVLMSLLLQNTLLIVVANYAAFLWSVWLFSQVTNVRIGVLLALLLGNATTLVSLLSVNKEILDLLATALFCYWISRRKAWALVMALGIALVNRYEICVAMLLYIGVQSRWNPLRRFRSATLIVFCIICSVALPILLSQNMTYRLEEVSADNSGILLLLDNLQMHFLFFLSIIPKLLLNLFAQLSKLRFDMNDPANTTILFFNNVANLFVLILLAMQKRWSLRQDWIYYAVLNAMVMSIALVVQPRYFYSFYAILCLEASRVPNLSERFQRLELRKRTVG
jgi:hypothetical protein